MVGAKPTSRRIHVAKEVFVSKHRRFIWYVVVYIADNNNTGPHLRPSIGVRSVGVVHRLAVSPGLRYIRVCSQCL